MTVKLDYDTRYRVAGWKGIAFRFAGFPTRWEPTTTLVEDPETGETWEADTGEGEHVEQDASCGRVLVVMVGDDKRHEVDVGDLSPLADGEFCGCCGQIGCHWGSA